MNGNENTAEHRLRENYPAIQITILSLIIALVYENLISEMRAQPVLFEYSPEVAFLWGQCVFMIASPAIFWFAHSLFACSVRPVYSRADALAPIGAALAFNVMVANLGASSGAYWMMGMGLLAAIGFFALGQFNGGYRSDSEVSVSTDAHTLSRRIMFVLGLGTVLVAGLLQAGILGYAVAGGFMALASCVGVFGILSVWYREWRAVLRLRAVA